MNGPLLAPFLALIRRDLQLAWRRPADLAAGLVFFVIVCSLFPLGVGPEGALLQRMAPGVLWVAALLASFLSLPRLFADDHRDGSLEQIALCGLPLPLAVAAKIFAHWLANGLPLALIAPLLGLQFQLPAESLGVLLLSLVLGGPLLSAIGAVGAALTLGLRSSGVLLALLVLPLYVPVLIFGAGAVDAVMAGLSPAPHLSLLAAGTLAGLALAPLPAAAALALALE
ncbi:heme exporter protein CcmB [Denitratisoma sp. agr-D3]